MISRSSKRHWGPIPWLVLAFWTGSGQPAAGADGVVAVLSSESPAYQEALAGFQEALGQSVPTFNLSHGNPLLPSSTRMVVTFGGKAALYPYPEEATLIYCLAPALFVGPDRHSGPRVRIFVAPKPEQLMAGIKEIQPAIKRLAVLDMAISAPKKEYLREMELASTSRGIQLRIEYLERSEDLPDLLRSLIGQVDAIWMAPNPLLITPAVFAMVKEYAYTKDTPLYAPMDSLVDKGAVASISSSFRESGRAAGRVAAQRLSGSVESDNNVYPERVEMVINLTAAKESGLLLSEDVIKRADRVVP